MLYINFVFAAMGVDFYPRLVGVIKNRAEACDVVNAQTEVALYLSGPIIFGLMATAPWLIHILYSADFAPAAGALKWQLLGDILKVLSWPLGMVILAAGSGVFYTVTQVVAVAGLMAGAYFLTPIMGIEATGIGFL